MATLPASLKFTYEEYCAFPEDGKRHEIIDGDHYGTPAPLTKHQRIVANLHRLIGHIIHEKKLGLVFSAPIDVLLSNVDVVQPDFLFVSRARHSIISEANIQGAPDLVVEILSKSTRKNDEGIKRLLYERAHVQEYWIIDPMTETVKQFHWKDTGFQSPNTISQATHTTFHSPHFTDLTLALSDLFA